MKNLICAGILLCLSIISTHAASGPFFINEVLFNPDGPDTPNNYIEIRGTPNSIFPAGTYLIEIESDSGSSTGEVQDFTDLSGLMIGSNGYFVILQPGNIFNIAAGANSSEDLTDIENTSLTIILAQTATPPIIGTDIDGNDDGLPDGSFYDGLTINDSVAALDGGTSDIGYGEINFINNGNGTVLTGTSQTVAFDPGFVGRRGDSTGSNPSDWVAAASPLEMIPIGQHRNVGATADFVLPGTGLVFPATAAGAPLNHIGWINGNFAPTTALVRVGGRVRTPEGQGLKFVGVSINGGSLPEPLFAVTNQFGFYRFENIPVGESYVLEVLFRKHNFKQTSLVINLEESILTADFIGSEVEQ